MNGNRNTKTIRKAGNRGRYLWIGGILSGFMVLLILISFFSAPYGTTAMDASVKFSPPTLQHIMGCDSYGRDIFSRILEGAGTSFLIAVCVVLIGVIAGTLIGALTGYFGGWADELLMRICDSVTAFPSILLALVVVAVVGGNKVAITWTLGISCAIAILLSYRLGSMLSVISLRRRRNSGST